MKITLVHDHLNQIGGAEFVLKQFHELWPQATTHTLAYDRRLQDFFGTHTFSTSFIDRLPGRARFLRWYLPLMPLATESYRFRETDLILSNCSAFAKGIIPPADAYHVSYCHTPTRYLWTDTLQYVDDLRAPRWLKLMLPFLISRLRAWDWQAAQRVDLFIANSGEVQKRIQRYYQRPSKIIYPPVDTAAFNCPVEPARYFLTGGRLVAYKRFDLIVEAFNHLGLPLVVFGTGPELATLQKNAKPNIRFTGFVSQTTRAELFSRCRAFIAAQREDFGLTTAEALAAGRPVIAYRAGGSLEIVAEGISGTFFDDQCWEAIADSVIHFTDRNYHPAVIRASAQKFSKERFQQEMLALVDKIVQARRESLPLETAFQLKRESAHSLV